MKNIFKRLNELFAKEIRKLIKESSEAGSGEFADFDNDSGEKFWDVMKFLSLEKLNFHRV